MLNKQDSERFRSAPSGKDRGCPCLYVEPCSVFCCCRYPWFSRGCRRCAAHGNINQRRKKARKLADIIDAAQLDRKP